MVSGDTSRRLKVGCPRIEWGGVGGDENSVRASMGQGGVLRAVSLAGCALTGSNGATRTTAWALATTLWRRPRCANCVKPWGVPDFCRYTRTHS